MTIDSATATRIRQRLELLYAEGAAACWEKILRLSDHYASRWPVREGPIWDERDVVLITYGDQIRCDGSHPLQTLEEFLATHGLDKLIRTVHILPFYPSSSDDGFAVIDYTAVDPGLGTWDDVRRLGRRFDLMFDLVLNHASSRSLWFEEYLAGREPYVGYFIEAAASIDLSGVTRPRSTPLLTEVETSRGTRHVWTTFSSDQVDLNFANPDVLIEMVDTLLLYVQQGARIIRLDAIAYLWKQVGTPCIHLPQTHEVVKLLRDLIGALAPHVLLLTETNVPHAENVSYFGDGDEAHLVYQFSLPPLLLDAFLSRDARPLTAWLQALQPASPGTTFFNFTASHDGVGVRPLEGLVSEDRLSRLVQAVRARGGLVSTRRRPDGTDAPYEMNVSYVSALGEPTDLNVELHARRFLTSQGLMLALRGMPAVYFHSLVGASNDQEGVRRSGQPRRINRRKFHLPELAERLASADSLPARIFHGYRRLLSVRVGQPAFHPEAGQEVWPFELPWLAGWLRTSIDETQRILVLANLSDETHQLDLTPLSKLHFSRDLLSGRRLDARQCVSLEPWSLVWLEAK